MDKKIVLVTGIGGNVGQGILRNILKTKFPIRIVGCNVADFSAGNHLCDSFYKVPFANDEASRAALSRVLPLGLLTGWLPSIRSFSIPKPTPQEPSGKMRLITKSMAALEGIPLSVTAL